jgi:hypothetical protein
VHSTAAAAAALPPAVSPEKREAWRDYSSVFTAAKAGMQGVDKDRVKKVGTAGLGLARLARPCLLDCQDQRSLQQAVSQ